MGVARRRIAYVLLAVAAIAAALALWAFLTGGFRVYVLGIALSVRGEYRPAFVAIVCCAIGLHLLGVARPSQPRISTAAAIFVRTAVPICTAIVLLGGLWFGMRVAGGSDSYGYVSQAALWSKGDLRIHQEFVAAMPWPNTDWTFTPLGYRPSTDHTLVPTYAPGLPLLMVLFSWILGSCGPFYVAPLCGAALVPLTYALGARLSGRPVGLMAALCIAASPTVISRMLWPMSDVPAATFWTASLLFASSRRLSLPFARWGPDPTSLRAAFVATSGAAAGIAILIRPNLAPLAVFPLAIAVWGLWRGELWPAARRLAVFGLGCVPFVLLVAWIYNDLYGSPLESGYGGADSIFSWANLRSNLARYPRWLWETQGPFVFLFVLAPLVAARGRDGGVPLRGVYFGFIAAVLACYLFYLPFDEWSYLRFLLPAFPLVFVLAADAVWNAAERFGPRTRRMAAVLFTVGAAGYGAMYVYDARILHAGRGEQKYADVGRFIKTRLPADAVLLSMQHSGSIRLYSGRLTLRYDILEPEWLDRALGHLRATGYTPYLVLDDWEVPVFRARFALQNGVSAVDRAPVARTRDYSVFLYGMQADPPQDRAPETMPRTSGCE